MNIVIILFSILIIAVGLVMIARPSVVMDIMLNNADSGWLHFLAVVVRLILGGALISYAGQSKFPLVLQIIGGLSIAAAVVIAVLPQERFGRLIRWVFDHLGEYLRYSAGFALILGAFLIYAVV
jgi:hypothetical protein